MKVRLVFWQLFDTGLQYNSCLHASGEGSTRRLLGEAGYTFPYSGEREFPDYVYEDRVSGYREKVRWLAYPAHKYMPLIFHIGEDTFSSPEGVKGSITLQAHLHYGGCLLFDCKMDFADYYTVSELVRCSAPKSVLLERAGKSLWDFMVEEREKILRIITGAENVRKRPRHARRSQTQPWHHTWIIRRTEETSQEELDNDTWQREFLPGGKYFRHALGLTQRSDTWHTLSTEFFSDQLKNHSPYENSVVYITNAGNVIVPNRALVNVQAFKNKLVDVIFATEMGNVQRFLSLVHVTNISVEAIKLQTKIKNLHEYGLSEARLAEEIRDMEEELTRIALEINDDLMVFKVRRLMFTSILKLTLFVEMIRSLQGYEYSQALEGLLSQMQTALTREREVLTMRVEAQESTLLKNLQLVFIVTLATEIIALFFYDPSQLTWSLGTELFLLALVITVVTYALIKATLRGIRRSSKERKGEEEEGEEEEGTED